MRLYGLDILLHYFLKQNHVCLSILLYNPWLCQFCPDISCFQLSVTEVWRQQTNTRILDYRQSPIVQHQNTELLPKSNNTTPEHRTNATVQQYNTRIKDYCHSPTIQNQNTRLLPQSNNTSPEHRTTATVQQYKNRTQDYCHSPTIQHQKKRLL